MRIIRAKIVDVPNKYGVNSQIESITFRCSQYRRQIIHCFWCCFPFDVPAGLWYCFSRFCEVQRTPHIKYGALINGMVNTMETYGALLWSGTFTTGKKPILEMGSRTINRSNEYPELITSLFRIHFSPKSAHFNLIHAHETADYVQNHYIDFEWFAFYWLSRLFVQYFSIRPAYNFTFIAICELFASNLVASSIFLLLLSFAYTRLLLLSCLKVLLEQQAECFAFAYVLVVEEVFTKASRCHHITVLKCTQHLASRCRAYGKRCLQQSIWFRIWYRTQWIHLHRFQTQIQFIR